MQQQTRRITWTQPPAPEILEALFDLEEAEAAPDKKQRQSEITGLRATVAGASVEEWRITLAALSVLTKSRYFAHVRSVGPWLEEAGITADDEGRSITAMAAYRAALVLASISQVERRTRPLLETNSADGWEPASAPAEWATVAGYMASAPPPLHDALIAAAEAINPQVALRTSPEQAKKYGGVSVS
jgi:hypothetical protein